ncbi:hypothetical protein [Bacillus timonensis]|uniref:hypothetical protein n=1 Tax=Bacillus timonensis TaxID=1033734 RepID=UPI0003149BCC|nr:hypothetical protein [Bacillus timonensis]
MKRKKEVEDFNGEAPLFDAPDDKILAFDMFRGISPGLFSDVDLDNPAKKIEDDIISQD